jgi:spore germination cell wall hydrolase CwlJ-like protein
MNRSILALLIAVALTGTTCTAQASSGRKFNAPVSGKLAPINNQVLPPVGEQFDRGQHGGRGSSSALGSPSAVQTTIFYRTASTIGSWTHKINCFLATSTIQENCLTTAVYFEARSESLLGQLAVAAVILNRVKASTSSSICGVVYKGASQLNACQFSFACDGKADLVDDSRAWKTAVEITALELAVDGNRMDGPMHVLATATNYHADYVNPEWSKSLNRLTKIGRHIFYSKSSLGGTKGLRKNYI